MTRQTSAPLTKLSLTTETRAARGWVRLFHEGVLDLNPPYQRGSVWSTDQRIDLVRSWLTGVPIPAVCINDRFAVAQKGRVFEGGNKDTYAVVDGKQRIETAILWFDGDLPVPASWFNPEDVETTVSTDDGDYVTFTGLNKTLQRVIKTEFKIPVMSPTLNSVQEEAALYVLLERSGVSQSKNDVERASKIARGL